MQINIKSTLVLSLAALVLTACGGGGTDYNFNPTPLVKASPAPAFSPADGGPKTNNLLFAGTTDGTLNIPNPDSNPIIAAMNTLDGFSTTNPIITNFSTPLDPTSLAIGSSIRVFEVTRTRQGVVTKVNRELGQQEILAQTVDAENKTLALIPLKPLKESTTYMVVLTRGIKDAEGTPVNSSGTYLLLKAPAIPDSATPDPAQLAQLRALRPLVNAMEAAASDDAVANKVAKDSIVLSWAFTTQSITPVLDKVAENATAGAITMVNTGLTPHDVNALLPGVSEDVYIGTLDVPYFLKAPDANDPTAALTSSWKGIGGSNLTRFNPTPIATSTLTIPVIMTIPKDTASNPKPASGWPIIMYQHGITRVRTDMLIYADNLAKAGFAMIAIDLPMHGITDPAIPFNAANTQFPNDREATFDMDFATGASPGTPDGIIDPSGTHFINLGSVLTSRDNIRQGVSNLLVLRRSLGDIPDIDANRVGFIAHSLGGLVGTTYLGVETMPLPTSLVTTGGGILGIIDKSASLGPFVRAGLAANGVTGALYQRFLLGAQTIVDSADPINFASSAAAVHPIHMIEVVGDGTADNLPDQTIPNIAGPLAGTEPLAALMGLKPVSKTTAGIAPGKGGIVRITQGEHASILRPSKNGGNNLTYLNVFTEMHREVTAFQASLGTTIVVTDESIVK